MLEGSIDSAHSSSLHSTDMRPARVESAKANDKMWLRPSTDKSPRLQVQRDSFGLRYAAIRRPIVNANTHEYFRITLVCRALHRVDSAEQHVQRRRR